MSWPIFPRETNITERSDSVFRGQLNTWSYQWTRSREPPIQLTLSSESNIILFPLGSPSNTVPKHFPFSLPSEPHFKPFTTTISTGQKTVPYHNSVYEQFRLLRHNVWETSFRCWPQTTVVWSHPSSFGCFQVACSGPCLQTRTTIASDANTCLWLCSNANPIFHISIQCFSFVCISITVVYINNSMDGEINWWLNVAGDGGWNAW